MADESVGAPTVATTPSPSAPASAPVTTSAEPTVTTDRPSFKDALSVFDDAAKAQGRRPRKSATTAEPSLEPAAIVPEGTSPGQPPPVRPGAIPTAEHIKAIENARTKTRSEVEQEYRTKYGDLEQASNAIAWMQRVSNDRVGFLRQVIRESANDPEIAREIASLAGTTLRGSRQPASTVNLDEPPPSVVVTGADGQTYFDPSRLQARDEYLIAKVKAEILGEVEPELQEVGHIRAEREADRQIQQLQQTMQTHLTKARNWPAFAEHEAEIKQALAKAPLTSGHPAEEALLLRETYDRIVGPKLALQAQDRQLAQLRKDATASTLNPSATGAPTGIPKTVRAKDGGSFGAALKWAEGQMAGR